jgi:hypothetical protein
MKELRKEHPFPPSARFVGVDQRAGNGSFCEFMRKSEMAPQVEVSMVPDEDNLYLSFKYEVGEEETYILPASVAAWLAKAIIEELSTTRGDVFQIKAPRAINPEK